MAVEEEEEDEDEEDEEEDDEKGMPTGWVRGHHGGEGYAPVAFSTAQVLLSVLADWFETNTEGTLQARSHAGGGST